MERDPRGRREKQGNEPPSRHNLRGMTQDARAGPETAHAVMGGDLGGGYIFQRATLPHPDLADVFDTSRNSQERR